ncbi:DMT family transporter [Paucilactobacillus sp. N302-9]
MVFLALVPIFMGAGLATQTAINSKLRQSVGSSYLASAISFMIGMLFLFILGRLFGQPLLPSTSFVTTQPWWIWLGGVFGVIGLTGNIVLFGKLGSIQASVLPILGQIIMGIIIDQFALFGSPRQSLTWLKLFGVTLLVIGVFITIGVFSQTAPLAKQTIAKMHVKHQLIYQIFGVIAGMLMASQTAINGHLGTMLGSTLQAATISFIIGFILLFLVNCATHISFNPIHNALIATKRYWWLWLGGVIGGAYILCSAWLVPMLGTGQVVILALFGQLLFSAIVEHMGLFDSFAVPIAREKIIGLIVMFISVVGIHFV